MIVQCNMNAPSFSAVILGGRRLRNGGENYTVFAVYKYTHFGDHNHRPKPSGYPFFCTCNGGLIGEVLVGVGGGCCVRGFCGRACALRWAVGSSGRVGAVARVRRFRREKLSFSACHFTRRCIHPEREPIGRPPSAGANPDILRVIWLCRR